MSAEPKLAMDTSPKGILFAGLLGDFKDLYIANEETVHRHLTLYMGTTVVVLSGTSSFLLTRQEVSVTSAIVFALALSMVAVLGALAFAFLLAGQRASLDLIGGMNFVFICLCSCKETGLALWPVNLQQSWSQQQAETSDQEDEEEDSESRSTRKARLNNWASRNLRRARRLSVPAFGHHWFRAIVLGNALVGFVLTAWLVMLLRSGSLPLPTESVLMAWRWQPVVYLWAGGTAAIVYLGQVAYTWRAWGKTIDGLKTRARELRNVYPEFPEEIEILLQDRA